MFVCSSVCVNSRISAITRARDSKFEKKFLYINVSLSWFQFCCLYFEYVFMLPGLHVSIESLYWSPFDMPIFLTLFYSTFLLYLFLSYFFTLYFLFLLLFLSCSPSLSLSFMFTPTFFITSTFLSLSLSFQFNMLYSFTSL